MISRAITLGMAALFLAACATSGHRTPLGNDRADFFAELNRRAGPGAVRCGWFPVRHEKHAGFACLRSAVAAGQPFQLAWQMFDGAKDTWYGLAGSATARWQVTYTTHAGKRVGVPYPQGVGVMPCTEFHVGTDADSRITCALSAGP